MYPRARNTIAVPQNGIASQQNDFCVLSSLCSTFNIQAAVTTLPQKASDFKIKQPFLDRWSKEFSRLVYRFRNTISGLFFGHTHFDEFKIFFAQGTLEPVNVAYLTPSQTPHNGLNPAYRVYILDGESHYFFSADIMK
jgi:hypothetical protein